MDQQRVSIKHEIPLFHASRVSLGYGKGTTRKGWGYMSGADMAGKGLEQIFPP